jgi:cobalt/nickel transport system permease protein
MYLDRLELKNDFPLSGLDPRCRVAAGVVCILSVLTVSRWYILVGLSLLLLVPAVLAGEGRTVLRRLVPVNVFCLFLWLTIPLNTWLASFVTPDPGSLVVDHAAAYIRAAAEALRYTLRINAAALLYMRFIVPLGAGGLANVLMTWGAPRKLAALLILTYRYIFLLYGRLSTALLSMAQRRPQQKEAALWRSYTAAFASSLAAALFRAGRIETAMKERGFDGAFPVTAAYTWKARDTRWLIGSVGMAAAAAFFFGGGGVWTF